MEWYHVWLFSMVDGVGCLLEIFSVIFLVVLVFTIIFCFVFTVADGPDNEIVVFLKNPRVPVKTYIAVTFILVLLRIAMPSQKELAAIYLLPKVVNNEQITGIPDKGLKLLNGKLNQWIAELADGKKEK